MTETPPAFQSYLLRFWQASEAGARVWRASIVNVHTGERRGFADLASLCTFLEAQIDSDRQPDDRPPPTVP